MSETLASGNTPPPLATDAAVCATCGQRLQSDENRKRNRFWWGVTLAWLPFVPIIIGLANAFRGISEQKATGIGAVAGGIAEMGIVTALTLTPACLIAAIALLARSFSRSHRVRSSVAVVSICWTVLMMSGLTLLVWLVYSHMPGR